MGLDHGPRITGHGRRRRGSSLLQMVVVMQVLLIVVMGAVEFGQYLYIKHAFQAAARDAARQAGLESATQQKVIDRAAATLGQANVAMQAGWFQAYDVSTDGATATAVSDLSTIPTGHRVKVVINTTYGQVPNAMRFLYGIFGKGIGPTKPIGGTCTAVRE